MRWDLAFPSFKVLFSETQCFPLYFRTYSLLFIFLNKKKDLDRENGGSHAANEIFDS